MFVRFSITKSSIPRKPPIVDPVVKVLAIYRFAKMASSVSAAVLAPHRGASDPRLKTNTLRVTYS